jgi:SAM-dependent methyltransferase
MDILSYNREAWNHQVADGNPWTVPVSSEEIAAGRQGIVSLLLTPTKPVPRGWYPTLEEAKVLCLASGGGQQGPILAAAGADVTVFDNSPAQLAQDRLVAEREGLNLKTIQGDMADLSVFPDNYFNLIFHPVSNVFVPDVRPVWREAFRVLKPGGRLLAGFTNPLLYLFDNELLENQRKLEVRHSIPYSDLESLSEQELQEYKSQGYPLEFSHTLQEQIGGQLDAGFILVGFYEDADPTTILAEYIPTFIATYALKPVE